MEDAAATRPVLRLPLGFAPGANKQTGGSGVAERPRGNGGEPLSPAWPRGGPSCERGWHCPRARAPWSARSRVQTQTRAERCERRDGRTGAGGGGRLSVPPGPAALGSHPRTTGAVGEGDWVVAEEEEEEGSGGGDQPAQPSALP